MKKEKKVFIDKINYKSSRKLTELKTVLSKEKNNQIPLIDQSKLSFELEHITDLNDVYNVNINNKIKNNTLYETQYKNERSMYTSTSVNKKRSSNVKMKYNNSKSQYSVDDDSNDADQIKIQDNYQIYTQMNKNIQHKTSKSNHKNHKITNSNFYRQMCEDPKIIQNKQNRQKQYGIINLLINDVSNINNHSRNSKSFIIKQNKRISYQTQNGQKKKQSYNSYSCKKSIQRRKYQQLKSKLQNMLNTIQSTDNIKFSQVFQVEQLVIKKFLCTYIEEIKKQCIEKGQFIQLIWNSFFQLINRILKIVTDKSRNIQKAEVKNSLALHEQYQQLYENAMKKVKQLGKKYNQSKNVIDRLIFDLRYKRKQTKKLYKNLALCNDQIITYKQEFTILQNHHIDLLMQTKLINKQSALDLIQKRQQLNKNLQQFKKLRINKQKIKQQILRQMNDEQISYGDELKVKKQLIQKINQQFAMICGGNIKKLSLIQGQTEQSALIDEYIQKFSSKCIPINESSQNLSSNQNIERKPKIKKTTAINTDFQFKIKGDVNSVMIQTTFSDKVQHQLIKNYPTQTLGPKVIKVQSVQVQADGDRMKIMFTKAKMTRYKVYDLSFYFDCSYKKMNTRSLIQESPKLTKKQTTENINFDQIIQIVQDSNEDFQNNNLSRSIIKKEQQERNISKSVNRKVNGNKESKNNTLNLSNNKFPVSVGRVVSKQHRNSFMNKFSYRQQNKKEEIVIPKKAFNKVSSFKNDSFHQNQKQIKDQKQSYIQNLVANKKQQFEIIDHKAVYQDYKYSILNDYDDKFTNQDNSQYSQQRSGPSLYQRNKERQSLIKKNQEELLKRKTSEFKQEKKMIRTSLLLNKILEFSVKKSKVKKVLDEHNFQACKQKSQYFSITQKLDPFLLDVDNLLKQKLGKGKLNRGMQLNTKTANKYIMMTYTKAIQKMSRNTTILQNLIKPLYESFQVIYGALKPIQIYKKMVSFISYVVSQRDQNQNYAQFLFFLGLDQKKPTSGYLTTLDVCLFLKMVEKLNLGASKVSSEIQTVWTSKKKVNDELFKILIQENMCEQVSKKVNDKILDVLERLDQLMKGSQNKNGEGQNKINVFKVSRMIVEEIIKIRMNFLQKLQAYTGFQPDVQPRKIKNEKFNTKEIIKIIQISQISSLKKLYSIRAIQQLSIIQGQVKMIKKNELAVLLLKIGVLNFDQLDRRFRQSAQLRKQLDKNYQSINGTPAHSSHNIKPRPKRINYQAEIKNLYRIQIQVEDIVSDIIGDAGQLNNLGLMKLLQNSISTQLI